MRDFRDAKLMARALRQELAARRVDISLAESLEIVARQHDVDNWNILAARIQGPVATSRQFVLPEGWQASGSKREHYDIGLDPAADPPNASIQCRYRAEDPAFQLMEKGYGVLFQSIRASPWRGRCVRFSAALRARGVTGLATMWLRVDDARGNRIRHDNLEGRTRDGVLRGTHGWVRRSIVLDVPAEAETIQYGFVLMEAGQMCARELEFGEAGPDEKSTCGTHVLAQPTNLSFGAT